MGAVTRRKDPFTPPRTEYRYVGIARESCRRSTERVWSRTMMGQKRPGDDGRQFVSIHASGGRSCGPPTGILDRNGDRGFSRAGSLGSLEENPQPTSIRISNQQLRGLRLYQPHHEILSSSVLLQEGPFHLRRDHESSERPHRSQKGGHGSGLPVYKAPVPPLPPRLKRRVRRAISFPLTASPLIRSALPRASPRVSTCSTLAYPTRAR